MWEEETRGRKQNFSSPAARPREEEKKQCRLKTALFHPFFFNA